MAKHRRAEPAPVAPSRPAREILIWTAFGCALVPLVLLWSGAGWTVAVSISGLIVLLALACALALRLSGLTLKRADPPPNGSEPEDERPIDPVTGP